MPTAGTSPASPFTSRISWEGISRVSPDFELVRVTTTCSPIRGGSPSTENSRPVELRFRVMPWSFSPWLLQTLAPTRTTSRAEPRRFLASLEFGVGRSLFRRGNLIHQLLKDLSNLRGRDLELNCHTRDRARCLEFGRYAVNNLARQHDGLATELEVDSDLNPASDLDRFTGRYE